MIKSSEYNISACKPNTDHNIIFGQQFMLDESGYLSFCRHIADNEESKEYLYPGKEDIIVEYVKEKPMACSVKRGKIETSEGKPYESYAYMIYKAIESTHSGKLTLLEIYEWIERNYPYYKTADPVWKNSIRHNLSLNPAFKKIPRPVNSKGKGGYWAIDYSVPQKEKILRKNMSARNIESNGPSSRIIDANESIKIINEKLGKLIF